MTLDRLRPVAERLLTPWVDVADSSGLTPDRVSVLAFGCAVLAAAGLALASTIGYVAAAALVFLNGWFDLIDGALARKQETASGAGDLLDHVLDRYADVLIIAGLAAGIKQYALGLAAVTGVLMTSYLGTQIQAIGLGREYGGLLGRADRLALVGITAAVAALFPEPLAGGLGVAGLLLVVFAIVGHMTALQRFWGAWSDL